MKIIRIKDMYLAELQEVRSAEHQLVEAMPQAVATASDPRLRRLLDHHLDETRGHLACIETILGDHGARLRRHTDQTMKKLIAETGSYLEMTDDRALRDAGLIAATQRIEHYEIAVYGALTAWANQLGHVNDAATFQTILGQEKSADKGLSQLAKGDISLPGAQ